MSTKTKVIIEDGKWFMIVKTDDQGTPLVGVKNVVKMGITKAKALLYHAEELEVYVKEMEK